MVPSQDAGSRRATPGRLRSERGSALGLRPLRPPKSGQVDSQEGHERGGHTCAGAAGLECDVRCGRRLDSPAAEIHGMHVWSMVVCASAGRARPASASQLTDAEPCTLPDPGLGMVRQGLGDGRQAHGLGAQDRARPESASGSHAPTDRRTRFKRCPSHATSREPELRPFVEEASRTLAPRERGCENERRCPVAGIAREARGPARHRGVARPRRGATGTRRGATTARAQGPPAASIPGR